MASSYSGGQSLLSSHVAAQAQYFSDQIQEIVDEEQVNSSILEDLFVVQASADVLANAYS